MIHRRFENIDGLRAIAAGAVFVQHLFGDIHRMPSVAGSSLSAWAGASIATVDWGRFGVVLFFLISGFVVPFSLKGDKPITHFVVSRVFRLYPALWAALLSLSLLTLIRRQPVDLGDLAADLTMAPSFFGKPWISGIYWTLSVEVIFYFAVGALYCARQLFRPGVIAAVGLGLVVLTALPIGMRSAGIEAVPVQYLSFHLSFLFTGLLLRLWLIGGVRRAKIDALALIAIQLAGVAAISSFSLRRGDQFALVGILPIISAYGLAVATFLLATGSGRPRSQVLGFLGRISYSLYLFHWMVCSIVLEISPLTGGPQDAATLALCIGATVLVCWATYSCVEKPAVILSHLVLRQVSRGRAMGGVTM